MKKVKVKKIKVPISNDKGIADLFNQMIGLNRPSLTIAYPKYIRTVNLCMGLIKLFRLVVDCPFLRNNPAFAGPKLEIKTFCDQGEAELSKYSIDLTKYEWNLSLVEEPLAEQFSAVYKQLKSSHIVHSFIIMCDNLVPYKKNFTNIEKFNSKFVASMAGVEWQPFQFTSLNLKYIFAEYKDTKNCITFFMMVLFKAFELSHSLYTEVSTPDIDVDQFVELLMSNVDRLRRIPELSRCGQAFKKIKSSVALLRDRFNGYYRDFVTTKDSSIMMQNFIIDVSKSTTADAVTARQFGVILAYYKKVANQHINDPTLKKLFDTVQGSLSELERDTKNLVKINKEPRDESSSGNESDSSAEDNDNHDDNHDDNHTPDDSIGNKTCTDER